MGIEGVGGQMASVVTREKKRDLTKGNFRRKRENEEKKTEILQSSRKKVRRKAPLS